MLPVDNYEKAIWKKVTIRSNEKDRKREVT